MYSNKCSKNVYYLPFKSKCLSNVNGKLLSEAYNLHYFLLSSNNPFNDNEVHLIEYNEQDFCVRNVNIFEYKGRIDQIICLDMYEEEERKKKKILLCTSGCNTSDLCNNENNKNEIENSCSLWLGDIETSEEQEKENIEIEEEKDLENMEIEDNLKVEQNDTEKLKHILSDETNQDKKECNEDDKKKENELKTNEINKRITKNKLIKQKKVPLKKIYELKSDQIYKSIKKIAIDDYEKEISKIAVIDKYSYSIFTKNNKDIQFIQSKNVGKQLTYGIFDPHHQDILTVMSDINIYGYDIKSNKQIFSAYTNHKANLSSIDFNSNIPNIVITSSNDGYIKLWDLRFLKNSFLTINIHSHWITSVNFNHFHDELLLTTSTDNTVKLHKIEFRNNLNLQNKDTNYELIKTYKDHEESVYQGKWSKTDAWIFASLSYDGKCVVNSVPNEQKYKILL
ncbi:conserved Plasmodium protein, unknown function [Plasmodium gallinaceum]|uniref:EIPR1-like beta-propeller domain-containing protein n=1 Tax=Plasmodium gallinaceum TaxID=5849 RepID=A0A1J1H2R4_PLAGA|nr:conserved Plasmodium protein, unknown function [Plasmodium gallinaceum]CRG97779.1 conserved Plasmodium protein, unknown function [Plasmodium gallinaceum]